MVVLPLLALVSAIVVGVPGVTPGETSVPFPVGSTAAAPVTGDAADLLATLPVKGKAAKTGYDRTGEFGSAWRDVDDNGCDTRNDILARDLAAIVTDASCRVLSGCWRRTRANRCRSSAARPPRCSCRSTIWSLCRTPGKPAPRS